MSTPPLPPNSRYLSDDLFFKFPPPIFGGIWADDKPEWRFVIAAVAILEWENIITKNNEIYNVGQSGHILNFISSDDLTTKNKIAKDAILKWREWINS